MPYSSREDIIEVGTTKSLFWLSYCSEYSGNGSSAFTPSARRASRRATSAILKLASSVRICPTAMYTSYKALRCRPTQSRSSPAKTSHQSTNFGSCYGDLLEDKNENTSSTSVKTLSELTDNNTDQLEKGEHEN